MRQADLEDVCLEDAGIRIDGKFAAQSGGKIRVALHGDHAATHPSQLAGHLAVSGTNLEPTVLRLRVEPFNNTPRNTREKEMLAKNGSWTVRFSSASHKSIVAGGAYSRRARRAPVPAR
jgi:hypothetical protein